MTLITILLGTLYAGTLQAAYFNGAKLFGYLEKNINGENSYDLGSGNGYLLGAADTGNGIMFCLPVDASFGQIKQIIYNYMQKHPQLWNLGAEVSVINALKEVYPCK